MDLKLYVKEGNEFKFLEVPVYVIKDLLRDRLSESEIKRIHRFAEKTEPPSQFKPGSVVVDFTKKTAQCFKSGINIEDLKASWDVE